MVLPADLLTTLGAFAQTIKLGVVCFADEEGHPIRFTSKIDNIFGYKDGELIGKPFNVLMPASFRERHDKILEKFKGDVNASTNRSMNGNNKVQGVAKNGELVPITVGISYHPGKDVQGLFLALIQDPMIDDDSEQFESVQAVFTTLLRPGVEIVKQTKQAIIRKITATGGILGFIAWFLAQVTPIGTAARAAYTAFNWKVTNNTEADVGVYEVVNDETRYDKLVAIERELKRYSSQVIAVAYYRLQDYGLGERQLKYVIDSSTETEVWFYDITDENLRLTSEDLTTLSQHECVLKKDAGFFPKYPERGKFSVILCPTLKVVKNPNNPSLKRIETVNVAGVAVPSSMTDMEPLATLFWRLLPNLENMY